jgi:hypothetical protein
MHAIARMRGRRGVALPVALVGLVAMTLLVTTALLTSTTEAASSAAQAGGTRLLYSAEGGLNEVLRAAAEAGTPLEPGEQVVVLAENHQRVRVTTALLHQATDPDAPGAWWRTYSLTAQPVDAHGATRGRAVAAMIRQERPRPGPLGMRLTAAVTTGGTLRVVGDGVAASGEFTGCGTEGGVPAVRVAADAEVADPDGGVPGLAGWADGRRSTGTDAVERSHRSGDGLAAEVLGGRTLADVIASVPLDHRWGPRWHPAGRRAWDGTVDPGEEVAVVDAAGGTVEIRGGAGMLVIVNGGMVMRDGAAFRGVVVVEGNFTLSGAAAVQGALVSLAPRGESVLVSRGGSIQVQYDRCMVELALRRFGDVAEAAPARFTGGTFAWSEVVR